VPSFAWIFCLNCVKQFLVEFGYCYSEVKEMSLSELDYVLEVTLKFLEKRREALEEVK